MQKDFEVLRDLLLMFTIAMTRKIGHRVKRDAYLPAIFVQV